jgi:sortase A
VVEVVRRDGERLRFRVTGARVARWDASGIPVRASAPRLALATCWPLDATRRGPLRYIVEAELAP